MWVCCCLVSWWSNGHWSSRSYYPSSSVFDCGSTTCCFRNAWWLGFHNSSMFKDLHRWVPEDVGGCWLFWGWSSVFLDWRGERWVISWRNWCDSHDPWLIICWKKLGLRSSYLSNQSLLISPLLWCSIFSLNLHSSSSATWCSCSCSQPPAAVLSSAYYPKQQRIVPSTIQVLSIACG